MSILISLDRERPLRTCSGRKQSKKQILAILYAGALLQACGMPASPGGQDVKAALPFAVDPNPSLYQPLPRKDLLLTGATVLDGLGGKLEHVDVLVQDGKISAMGAELVAPAGVTVVDASGRWLTPGIIDVHSHNGTYSLPLTSQDFAISDISEISDPNAAEIWIEHGINTQDLAFRRALAGGVTTLQILPGSVPVFGGRSVVLKNIPATTVYMMKFPGAQQGVKLACGENPKSHFGESGDAPTSRMGEIALMRKSFLEAGKYLREWGAFLQDGSSGEAPERNLELDTLAGILHGDLRVQVHCYTAPDIAVMLGVAREFGFHIDAFHHAAEAYKVPELLVENDTCAAVWADWWGYKLEAVDAIRENAAMLDAAGVCTILHSDSPVTGKQLNVEASKSMGAGRRAGIDIPPERAIRWLTSNPARALGLEDQVGQITPGFNADIVIWSGNPFSIYSAADQVYIDGALVFDRRDPGHQSRADIELGFPGAGTLP